MAGDGGLTAAAAKRMTVAQLKEELEKRDLETDGKKDALLKRLLEDIEGNGTEQDLADNDGAAAGNASDSEDAPKKRKRDADEGSPSGEAASAGTKTKVATEEDPEAEPESAPRRIEADAEAEDSGDDIGPTFDMIGGAGADEDDDEDIGPVPGVMATNNVRKKTRSGCSGEV